MRHDRTTPLIKSTTANGVCVADGYGVHISVNRGQLVVKDGAGRQRNQRNYPRVRSGLERLVVIGRNGTVTLEAMRWLADLGIGYIHVDRDGSLLATSTVSVGDARLRRIQTRATLSPIGIELAQTLLSQKLAGQRTVLEQIPRSAEARRHLDQAIAQIEVDQTLDELMTTEREAALAYWSAWTGLEITFTHADSSRIPAHWTSFGRRRSPLSGGQRVAINPANALLNYLYAILAAEARIACFAVGLDPTLGVIHVDYRDRDSFVLDLMEVVRPDVDRYVLELVRSRTFTRKDFLETGRGQCKIRAPFSHELVKTGPHWARLLAPLAEAVARRLAAEPDSRVEKLSTPLTRDNHTASREAQRRRPSPVRTRASQPASLPNCKRCGGIVPNRRRVYCDKCLPEFQREQLESGGVRTSAVDVLKARGGDPTHGNAAALRRGRTNVERKRQVAEWEKKYGKLTDLSAFARDILPEIQRIPLSRLVKATGLSLRYCSQVRRGEKVPHPRHWDAFLDAKTAQTE
jgi:CRISPR-associated endonuclease Cas1